MELIIGAVIAIVGSVVSAISSSESALKAQNQQHARRNEAERRYMHEINKDFLDTATAKSTMSAIRKQNDKQIEALGNNAVKTGASDEAKIAAAARANETYAEATSRIAGYGTQYKQNIENQYQSRMDQLDDSLINLELEKANAWAGMGNSAAAVGSAFGQAYGEGAFSKTSKQAPASTTTTTSATEKQEISKESKPRSTTTTPVEQNAETIARNAVAPPNEQGSFVPPHTIRWRAANDSQEHLDRGLYNISERVKKNTDTESGNFMFDLSLKNLLWQK